MYNGADIDGSRVVWARDRGDGEDQKLLQYYPDRAVLLLEPDARPPKLGPYRAETLKAPEKKEEQKDNKKDKPRIVFEPIR